MNDGEFINYINIRLAYKFAWRQITAQFENICLEFQTVKF